MNRSRRHRIAAVSRRRGAVAVLGALTCAFAVIVACTGEDPELREAPPPAPDADVRDAPSVDDKDASSEVASPEVDGGHDAGDGLTSCDGGLVDTKTNPDHCGVCGHDCAGGECVGGTCQPFTIADHLARPYGVTTGGTGVLWVRAEGDGGAVESCPISGCAGKPTLITGAVLPPYEPVPTGTTIVSDGFYALWIARRQNVGAGELNHVFGCYLTACSTTKELSGIAYSIIQLASIGSRLIYRTSGDSIRSCAFASCEGDPPTITSTTKGTVAFAFTSGRLFYADSALGDGGLEHQRVFACSTTDFTSCANWMPMFAAPPISFLAVSGAMLYAVAGGELLACGIDGCANSPEVIATDLGDVSAFAVDEAYAYIAKPGEPGTKTGSILACALPKCAGGLRTLASDLAVPNSLRAAGGVLYWSNAGDVPGSGSIQKIRP